MSPEQLQGYMDKLKPVWEKLAEIGAQGYQLVLRQVLIDAVGSLLWITVFIVFLVFCIKMRKAALKWLTENADTDRYAGTKKRIKEDGTFDPYTGFLTAMMDNMNGDEDVSFIAGLGGFLFTCAVLACMWGIYDNLYKVICYLVNPHWYAIQKIAELVK
jgi:hypothetical protein